MMFVGTDVVYRGEGGERYYNVISAFVLFHIFIFYLIFCPKTMVVSYNIKLLIFVCINVYGDIRFYTLQVFHVAHKCSVQVVLHRGVVILICYLNRLGLHYSFKC